MCPTRERGDEQMDEATADLVFQAWIKVETSKANSMPATLEEAVATRWGEQWSDLIREYDPRLRELIDDEIHRAIFGADCA
jgi:hypothetical protein